MRIGFDAKRAYHNTTGLGNYSRTLIENLAAKHPEHSFFLYNPKPSSKYKTPPYQNVDEVLPATPLAKTFGSFWRSLWLTNDLKKHNIDLFHGLSHELPSGIRQSGVRSVVTIHDLIFELYPEQFNPLDVLMYRQKFRHACTVADRIIAISQQTKKDIVRLYGIAENKIDVCHQSCNPAFGQAVSAEEKRRIREKYQLPSQYFLSVGSVIERKNLLGVCKAIKTVKQQLSIPLVVIGDGKKYKEEVKQYLRENGLLDDVIFLSEKEWVKNDAAFKASTDLPAIYQMAMAMIYPSFYEGFGLPVLEALWSKVPVITSSVSCLPEAGGPGAFYVDPSKPEEIAEAMRQIAGNASLVAMRVEEGYRYAQKFTAEETTKAVMAVYEKVMG